MAAAFDRPHPSTWRVSISESQRLRVAARLSGSRCLSDDSSRAEHRQLQGHADRDGCRHRSRSPARLQASRPILRLVGSGTPVWSRETARQVCDESRRQGGQAPDQANSGRQAGVAVHARTIHSQDTQTRPDARRVTNDTEDHLAWQRPLTDRPIESHRRQSGGTRMAVPYLPFGNVRSGRGSSTAEVPRDGPGRAACRLLESFGVAGVDGGGKQGDEHGRVRAAPAGDGIPAGGGVVAADRFGWEARCVVAGGDVVECAVVEGAVADAVDGGVNETELVTGVLVGEGESPAQSGALALVPPGPLTV